MQPIVDNFKKIEKKHQVNYFPLRFKKEMNK
jgi:hypothetical protein